MSPTNTPAPGPEPEPACAEDALVARLAAILATAGTPLGRGELGIGDDAAVVAPPAGHLVVSVDTAVAGVHADLTVSGPEDLGFKALTAAVSDLAAMGADPRYALVSLCLPSGPETPALMTSLGEGLADAARTWGCPVIGGDLTSAPAAVVSVTVIGEIEAGVGDPDGPLTRSGARAGDTIFVTGPLGAAAAGLRILRARPGAGSHPAGEDEEAVRAHTRPAARLAEGRTARRAGATAAMDVSDGLGLDLHRLAAASGVGVALDTVPVAPAATKDEAIGGGEDYELAITTADPDGLREAFSEAGLREPIEIGRCTADPAERTLEGAPFSATGYQHHLG